MKNSEENRCLFCKRIMKDDVFHVCPSRVPSMGQMGVPRNKKAAQQSEQAEEVEIDPVAQALRNLGDAIAPDRL